MAAPSFRTSSSARSRNTVAGRGIARATISAASGCKLGCQPSLLRSHMSQHFNVMDENPNQASGSNGCLCSDVGTQHTQGPFIVFNATEMDTGIAPYPVLCAGCALVAAREVSRETAPPERQAAAPKRSRKPADEDGPEI